MRLVYLDEQLTAADISALYSGTPGYNSTAFLNLFNEIHLQGVRESNQISYILATVRAETSFVQLHENPPSNLTYNHIQYANPHDYFVARYNGRNGNISGTDDGYIFRGHGYIQITGRGNFQRVGDLLGIDLAVMSREVVHKGRLG